MSPDYIWHVTIDTGHARRSPRGEVDLAVVTIVRQMIAEAAEIGSAEIRPGYTLVVVPAGSGILATVESIVLGPIATIGVSTKSKASGRLWQLLKADGEAPNVPWCAVRLYPAAEQDHAALSWLGDFERCLAWACLERGQP